MLAANRSTKVSIDGTEYLYFGGTNYLGLAHRVELFNSAAEAFARFGWSSGASRLTSGENEFLLAFEQELAEFAQVEAALALPAGYMSNQAVVEGLDDDVAAWVISKKAHASIQSAVGHSKKTVVVLESQHEMESESVRARLDLGSGAPLGYFVEPIEALDGQLADLPKLISACRSNDFIVLDEAQSFGVLGDTGRGALEHFAIKANERMIRTGTCSKALGTYGGFILACNEIVSLIKSKSPSFRGSTSLPPLLCSATTASIRLLKTDPASTILALKKNIAELNRLLVGTSFAANGSNCVPIYYLPFSPEVARIQELLPKQKIYMPSVKNYFPGTTEIGLRWTIQSGHIQEDFERLVDTFSEASQ